MIFNFFKKKDSKIEKIIGENLSKTIEDFYKDKKDNFKNLEPHFSRAKKYSGEQDIFLEKHYGKDWFIKFKDLKNEVSDEHLSKLSVTVGKWIYEKSKVSNDYIDSSRPSKVLSFIKLFLEEEKKRKYIKSYNITDIILLNLLSKNISLNALDKIESKMDYKMCLLFEKEIGYKETN